MTRYSDDVAGDDVADDISDDVFDDDRGPMPGNSFGQFFRITTFGESHGGAVGVVIDGVPGRQTIDLDLVQKWLDRRRPGQGDLVSQRQEADRVECLSGLQDGVTLGSPICLMVRNTDVRPEDYAELSTVYRPSHADFTTDAKYGIRAASGGGRASARETVGRVAAGAVANQIVQASFPGIEVVAWVESVHGVTASVDPLTVTLAEVHQSAVRCPVPESASAMIKAIEAARADGDSVGGVIGCVVRGLPAGLGEPVFDKLEADLAKALMSLPATKGFEVGSGFAGTLLRGSEHNDAFVAVPGIHGPTATNRSGGIQGGISNGAPVTMRVAFKPVASIAKPQDTVTKDKKKVVLAGVSGRHDPCVLPRAVPMVEAMVWIVILDHLLRNKGLQLDSTKV